MNKPFAWSYSALSRYENCPKQYYHLNVIKDVKDDWSTKSDQQNEGTVIHEALYNRVLKGKPLPLAYRHYESIASRLEGTRGEKEGEIKLALNREFKQTGFFDNDVYLRVIFDLLIRREDSAILLDYKTGKVRPDETQLELFAASAAAIMPEIKTFTAGFVWLKAKDITVRTYTREDMPGLWANLLPRAKRIEEALRTTDFPARKTPLCDYCPVKSCPNWHWRKNDKETTI